jgi:hypothetical protein
MRSKKELKINLENINNKRYSTLKISDEEMILEYEINMIKNNRSLPFLELDIVQINSNKKVLYQLDNKIALSSIIEDYKYNIEEIISILESIYKCTKNMKEFMLDNRKIVLDYKNIYVDNNLVPYMIYLPFREDKLSSIKDSFNELIRDIVKDLKEKEYDLTNNDKKMLNKMTSNRLEFDDIGQLFSEYSDKKNEERLLDKASKKKEDKDINYEDSHNNVIRKEVYNQEIKEDIKDINNRKYKSIIEEDYSNFEDFDHEEDIEDYLDSELEYEEYKDIHKYDKKMDSRQKDKKIIIIQLIILMMLGSLGLIISYDDKKIFIGISVAMLIVIIIFTYLIISNNKSKGE